MKPFRDRHVSFTGIGPYLILLSITASLLLFSCGDDVLNEVKTFHPNNAPQIRNITILDSDRNEFTCGSPLLPNMLFFLTIEVEEIEGQSTVFEYSAEIPGSADSGSFNNIISTVLGGNMVIGSTTYALPPTLPLGSQVLLTITITDTKNASTIYTFELGPVKPAPNITEVTATGLTSSPITVEWYADSDGFYQFYLLTDADVGSGKTCTIDLSASAQVFKYYRNEVKIVSSPYSLSDGKFCIVIFDALDQFDSLEYNLP